MTGIPIADGTRPNWAALAAGLAGTAVAVLAISRLPDPALLPLLAVTMLVGATFVLLDFGFSAGFRSFIERGDGRALGAAFVVPAVAALVVVPVGTMVEGYGRFVAPVGVSLLAGAALFGVGMQLASGCGSGALVAAGRGSRRMWVALPFFCLGGVAGSLALPSTLALPSLGGIDLSDLLGPWGALAATEGLLLAAALAVLRGARPSRAGVVKAAIIGGVAAAIFAVSGQPWGITMGFTLWGAKAVSAAGVDLSGSPFWSDPGMAETLRGSVFAMHSSTADVGVILGALVAAAATGRLSHATPIGRRAALAAALGGALMGIGSRLAFGCNIGAFVGGASSASLHGLVWVAAALPGCWLGLHLRRLFREDGPPAIT